MICVIFRHRGWSRFGCFFGKAQLLEALRGEIAVENLFLILSGCTEGHEVLEELVLLQLFLNDLVLLVLTQWLQIHDDKVPGVQPLSDPFGTRGHQQWDTHRDQGFSDIVLHGQLHACCLLQLQDTLPVTSKYVLHRST